MDKKQTRLYSQPYIVIRLGQWQLSCIKIRILMLFGRLSGSFLVLPLGTYFSYSYSFVCLLSNCLTNPLDPRESLVKGLGLAA